MRGDFCIYLNFVNGNYYQAVFRVAQQIPPLPDSQLMPTVSSTPIIIPNLLSQYVRAGAVLSNLNSISPLKLATVFYSASLSSLQKRPRKRLQKIHVFFLPIFTNCFTIYLF